jgi:hypothetical protein
MMVEPTVPLPPSSAPGLDGCQTRRRNRAIHDQRAGVHIGRAGIAVDAGQRQRSAAGFHQRAAKTVDPSAHIGGEIVAPGSELVGAESKVAGALN